MELTRRMARMQRAAVALSRRPMFRQGFRDCLPLTFGIAAWGLVAGMAMVKGGLSVPLALMMSLLVSAGSAQLAVLPLIATDASMWVVWATVACVNLRFLVFSVQYRPYFGYLPRRQRIFLSYFLGDTIYAIFLRRFPEPKPAPGQLDFFWGAIVINYGAWQLACIIGIVGGEAIPQHWGIGFAGTMALLALTCSQLRSPSAWVAALVAACAAVAAYALPLRLNILVAIAAAVAVGVIAHQTGRRKS